MPISRRSIGLGRRQTRTSSLTCAGGGTRPFPSLSTAARPAVGLKRRTNECSHATRIWLHVGIGVQLGAVIVNASNMLWCPRRLQIIATKVSGEVRTFDLMVAWHLYIFWKSISDSAIRNPSVVSAKCTQHLLPNTSGVGGGVHGGPYMAWIAGRTGYTSRGDSNPTPEFPPPLETNTLHQKR